MRIILIFLCFVFFQSCSFDDKSGIWKSESKSIKEKNEDFSQFKDLSTSRSPFNRELSIKDGFNFILPNPVTNLEWTDVFYNQSNSSKNFKFTEFNNRTFRSKKITKHTIDDYFLYHNENIISTDQAGNLNIFSLVENKKIISFNFYKKKFKKNKKKLNIIVEKNIIYVSDNLGYLYSFDYQKEKVLWAKNLKIPFRSNLKIFQNKLILSNQNNQLYFINKNNGDILKVIPTEETLVKNKFINNISLTNESTFFLNTFGSLYSIDNKKMQINWFLNFNQSSNISPSNLFLGNKLINTKDKIVVSSNFFTYVIDINTGSILFKKNFSSFIKPIIINNYLFLITKNDLIISLNLDNGEIIYSHNINKKISKFLKTKEKKANFKNISMINNQIYIFLQNSYVLVFKVDGKIEKIFKLPSKLNSQPILIEESMMFLDSSNKISIVN